MYFFSSGRKKRRYQEKKAGTLDFLLLDGQQEIEASCFDRPSAILVFPLFSFVIHPPYIRQRVILHNKSADSRHGFIKN